jgi:hypothetical protein
MYPRDLRQAENPSLGRRIRTADLLLPKERWAANERLSEDTERTKSPANVQISSSASGAAMRPKNELMYPFCTSLRDLSSEARDPMRGGRGPLHSRAIRAYW